MDVMRVEVVSNEYNIYSGEASFVVVPTVQGELGIYPRHEPIMSLVRPGALRLKIPGEKEEVLVAVSGGVLEVQPDKLTVLADVAVRSSEMDQARAEEAKKAAEAGIAKATKLWPRRIVRWLLLLQNSKLSTIFAQENINNLYFRLDKKARLAVLLFNCTITQYIDLK